MKRGKMSKNLKVLVILAVVLLALFAVSLIYSVVTGESIKDLIKRIGGGRTQTQCNDKIDNDGDGFVDYNGLYEGRGRAKTLVAAADPDCSDKNDNSEARELAVCVPSLEICDGVDNDCDGLIDEGGVCTPVVAGFNPFEGRSLYVWPTSNAKTQAELWRNTRPEDALQMDKIAAQPQVKWIGYWDNPTLRETVDYWVTSMTNAGAIPTLVTFNHPWMWCNGGGGASSPEEYASWIRVVADALKGRETVIILEPDAVAEIDCLNSTRQQERFAYLTDAVQVLTNAGAHVYIDAGNPPWHDASTISGWLNRSGVQNAQGFSLNVANFVYDEDNIAYGELISQKIGGKHFVIDTSRNGLGPAPGFEWCNPDGRALGKKPTTSSGHGLVDAYLWIKAPGESDGFCNGGPAGGEWWPEYALGLAQRASY